MAQYHLFLTSVHLSLPLFRDLLTTAHTQVCTVIRFSQSRFVPASRLLVLLDLPLSLSETLWPTDLDAANVYSFPLFLSLFVDSPAFTPLHPRSETVLYHFSSSLFSAIFLLLFCCIPDGLPPIWPWLSLWRAVQHLSETLSKGRPLMHACVHLRPANQLFSLTLD